jgi:glycosyltransferase involved in cell wall biosynthesis
VDEGITLVEKDIDGNHLGLTLEMHYRRILEHHVPEANVPILRGIYQSLADVPVFRAPSSASNRMIRSGVLAQKISTVGNLVHRLLGRRLLPAKELCFGIWHEFHKPPYGGGNQFMLALRTALRQQGARVISNRMSKAIDVHLCNSAWFDRPVFERALSRGRIRMIHRVDGPVALYRGTDWSEDERIHEINRQWASATVFQSAWSFHGMKEHGLDFARPVIIRNGVDPEYFYPLRRRVPAAGGMVRIISTSWSDNPNKGGALYQWLDEHLDFDRFEYTYVGRIQSKFRNIRHVPPQDSQKLGELLRQHDLYITASRNEPCSNALLEAMACDLPALYLNQGGHSELVGSGGLPFNGPEDILTQLNHLVGNLDAYRNCIWLQTIDEIANRYIELARLLINDMP